MKVLLVQKSSPHLIHCHTAPVALAGLPCTPAGRCWGRRHHPGDSTPAGPAARAVQTGTHAEVGAVAVEGRVLAPVRQVRALHTQACACAAVERPHEVLCR